MIIKIIAIEKITISSIINHHNKSCWSQVIRLIIVREEAWRAKNEKSSCWASSGINNNYVRKRVLNKQITENRILKAKTQELISLHHHLNSSQVIKAQRTLLPSKLWNTLKSSTCSCKKPINNSQTNCGKLSKTYNNCKHNSLPRRSNPPSTKSSVSSWDNKTRNWMRMDASRSMNKCRVALTWR